MNMLNGIVNAASARGYSTVIGHLGKDAVEEKQNMDQLKTRGVTGFVIFPRNNLNSDEAITELFYLDFPFVLVDRFLPDLPCSFVGIDNAQAAYQAVSYLISRGNRSIGFATSADMNTTTIRDRFEGYRKALSDNQINYRSDWLLQTPQAFSSPIYDEEDEAAEITNYQSLLRNPRRPQAIFAINDITANLVAKAAKADGISIPDELALVGFDNDVYARQAEVPLTTIAQPFEEIGARAAHLLIDRIRGAITGFERVLLPAQLVVRQSCGEALDSPSISVVLDSAERRS
jgi:DNA-binding LacI/PurR family transcriptional regulator